MSYLLKNNVYAVGIVDWNSRYFHESTYIIRQGTTYNSYLILDKKNVLIDTVHKCFKEQFISNIKSIIDPRKIDIIIINHIEPDHVGSLPSIIELCPNAIIYGTNKAKLGFLKYYNKISSINWKIVKSGQELVIGKRTLKFIEMTMIHWPDSMLTYSKYDNIVFSNDAFGQHYATNKIFDDEVNDSILFKEAQKYYANILWPFNSIILPKLNVLKNLTIKMIAPSHGLIWRKNTSKILEIYINWASNLLRDKVTVIYESMWGSTAKMANKFIDGLTAEGIAAHLLDVTKTDKTDILAYMLNSKGWIIGSSTKNRQPLHVISNILEYIKYIKAPSRISLAFGSYGWSGESIKYIENILTNNNTKLCSSYSVVFKPTYNELKECFNIGRKLAINMKQSHENKLSVK
jgi:flavorubredoxin